MALTDDAATLFAQLGGQMTAARRRIIDAIPRDGAFRADTLWHQVRAAHPELGRATLFRTLRILQDMGLVERIAAGEDEGSYRWCAACAEGHHHHLRCVACGRDIVVRGDALRQLEETLSRVASAYDFAPVSHAVELAGLCARCRAVGAGNVASDAGADGRASPDALA
jgi:Fur family ferric uptake transcriptional regulator